MLTTIIIGDVIVNFPGPVQGLDFWEFIDSGEATTHQDFGLTTYTTYLYRVTVYNDIGSETSDPSAEVTTLAGQPTVPGTITAAAIDHISVMLNWTTPCKILELAFSFSLNQHKQQGVVQSM